MAVGWCAGGVDCGGGDVGVSRGVEAFCLVVNCVDLIGVGRL